MRPASVRHNNHLFERHALAQFLKGRQEHVINKQKPVFRMIHDRRELMRVQPQVQRVQDSSRARHSKERFEVSRVVPHHGADPLSRPQAQSSSAHPQAVALAGKNLRRSFERPNGPACATQSLPGETVFPPVPRSRANVSGKSIIVPRIEQSYSGSQLAASYHYSAAGAPQAWSHRASRNGSPGRPRECHSSPPGLP